MSAQALLKAEVESFWISLRFNKVYLTAKTLNHCIADNQVVEEKSRKVSLILTNPSSEDLQHIYKNANSLVFIVDSNFDQIVDKNGYVLNRFQIIRIEG